MKKIGILTSGGDCPGLNAAIRGVCRTGNKFYNMKFIGFKDGFRGLVNNNYIALRDDALSGILTLGGTILGTSRDKPHRMKIDGEVRNMVANAVANYKKHNLNALVCIGGGGTQKNAFKLHKAGLNIITMPKTIDNDVANTDLTFGFDTALGIATNAIDRLHSTAMSHKRIIVVEVMGHRAGWLALGSGIAGGAEAILIPEIPYDENIVAEAILDRTKSGKLYSIIVVAEGAMSYKNSSILTKLEKNKKLADTNIKKQKAATAILNFYKQHVHHTLDLTNKLEKLTKIESKLTVLGHLQRGGTPTATDRLLATRLGTSCAKYIKNGKFGVMVALKGKKISVVNLDKVAGIKKLVPKNHPWVKSARKLGICMGD